MGFRLRITKLAFVMMAGLLGVGAGAGYSLFVFSDAVSREQEVLPSPETIRQNFSFNEMEESDIFNTKYYTVNFFSQNFKFDPNESLESGFYRTGNFQSWNKWLGHFQSVETSVIDDLGGTVIQRDDGTVSCISFPHISIVTQDILEAIGVPICSTFERTLFGNGNYQMTLKEGLNDGPETGSSWPLSFLSWTFDTLDIYQGLGGSGDNWTVNGLFPGDFTIPNFNLSLSTYESQAVDVDPDGIPNSGDETSVLNIYPIYTVGKDRGTGDSASMKVDNIEMIATETNETGTTTVIDGANPEEDGISFESYYFAYDSVTTAELAAQGLTGTNISPADGESIDAYRAYRLSGLTIDDLSKASDVSLTIVNDMYRRLDDQEHQWWGTEKPAVPTSGGFSSIIVDHRGNAYENGLSLDLVDYIGEPGRYNVYLFVKEKYYSNGSYGGSSLNPFYDEDNIRNSGIFDSPEFQQGELAIIYDTLDGQNVHAFKASALGYSLENEINGITFPINHNNNNWVSLQNVDTNNAYSFENYGTSSLENYYITGRHYRSYAILIEKSYDPELLGGPTGNWDYSRSDNDHFFIQNSDDNDEYEVRNVDMLVDNYSQYELKKSDGSVLGTLSLPGTYLSVGLDSANATKVSTVEVKYGGDGKPTDPSIPKVTVYDNTVDPPTSTEEYYFSYNPENLNESLMTLGQLYSYDNVNNEQLNEFWKAHQVTFTPNGGGEGVALRDYLRDEKIAASDIDTLYEALAACNVVSVPAEGQYNFYLRFSYAAREGGTSGEVPSIEVFAYRIHNIFVKILDGEPVMNEQGFLDVNDVTYNGSSGNGSRMYSSQFWYYIYDTLSLDDVFVYKGVPSTLGQIFDGLKARGKCLKDIVSGRYLTPYSMEEEPFIVMKNYVLQVVDCPAGLPFDETGNLRSTNIQGGNAHE